MHSPRRTRAHPFASTLKTFRTASGKPGRFHSLPALARTYPNIARLPVSIRIVLESVLRNCDGERVTPEHVEQLANWQPNAERSNEIAFVVARVVLQDFTGVPLLADLAAMRNVAQRLGKAPKAVPQQHRCARPRLGQPVDEYQFLPGLPLQEQRRHLEHRAASKE